VEERPLEVEEVQMEQVAVERESAGEQMERGLMGQNLERLSTDLILMVQRRVSSILEEQEASSQLEEVVLLVKQSSLVLT
jgi:hypothetical protein